VIGFLLLVGCEDTKRIQIGTDVNEDYSKFSSKYSIDSFYSKDSINLVLLNNPIKIDSSDEVLLLLNDIPVFFDKYAPPIRINIPIFKEGESIHPVLYVIKDSKITRFENKSVFVWNDRFNCLYVGFFPENQEIEQILFFPQEFTIVQ
jgi:hypothetical protein